MLFSKIRLDGNLTEYTHDDNERIPVESMLFETEAIYSLLQRFSKQ